MIPTLPSLKLMLAMGVACVAAVSGATDALRIPESEDYTVRTWEMDDGLPSNRIFTIAQTPDGYLWLGTQDGLTRFDGQRFTSFPVNSNAAMQTDRVHALFAARDGTLWIGQVGGAVGRKVGETFEAVLPLPADPVPFEVISGFAESADGAIWIAYERTPQLTRWHQGKLRTFTTADGIPEGVESTVKASRTGEIWFANSAGVAAFDGTRFVAVDPAGGGTAHVAAARDGGMWSARDNRLIHYGPDRTPRRVADLTGLSVHGLFEDSGGTLWIETNMNGLIRFRDGQLVRVPVVGTSISMIIEDLERNLWVGRQSGGLNRVRPRQFYLHQADDGVLEDETYSVAEDTEGRVWLSGRANMLVRATDTTNARFATPPGWNNTSSPRSVATDPAGGMWIGTLDGLMRWQNDQWRLVSPWPNILGMIRDRSGAVWIATADQPLARYQDGETALAGPARVRAIAQDQAGNIWAGSDFGDVYRKNGDTWEPVELPHGKPSGRAHVITADENNTVWIAVARAGLYRWREGKAERVPPNAGIPTEDVRAIIITPEGDFWIGTGRGLFHTRRTELDAVLAGRQQSMWFRSFGRNDGVPIAEFGVGYRSSSLRTRDGHLWFATDRGALEIVPGPVEPEAPVGRVLIEDVTVAEKPLGRDREGRFHIPAGAGTVAIRYTLPHLTRPEEIHFRYRLTGTRTEGLAWAGTERLATFPRLPAGEYQFEVDAIDASGRALPARPATALFVIEAAWWETPLAQGVAIVLGIAALSWVVRQIVLLRVRARMKRLEQDRALERERSRIARDMHDQLGASLTQIAITTKLLTLDPPERVATHSKEIAAIARRSVESLDEIVWAVDPANDSLTAALDYLGQFAVNFLGTAGIECEMMLPEDPPAVPLPARTRHHVFLAVKEALHNIVKHAGATRVNVKFHAQAAQAALHIEDNGRGITSAPAAPGADGLRNMSARMQEIGGSCRIDSAPDSGTRITFTWPLPATGTAT